MKIKLLLLIAIVAISCSKYDIPKEKEIYVGHWKSEDGVYEFEIKDNATGYFPREVDAESEWGNVQINAAVEIKNGKLVYTDVLTFRIWEISIVQEPIEGGNEDVLILGEGLGEKIDPIELEFIRQ